MVSTLQKDQFSSYRNRACRLLTNSSIVKRLKLTSLNPSCPQTQTNEIETIFRENSINVSASKSHYTTSKSNSDSHRSELSNDHDKNWAPIYRNKHQHKQEWGYSLLRAGFPSVITCFFPITHTLTNPKRGCPRENTWKLLRVNNIMIDCLNSEEQQQHKTHIVIYIYIFLSNYVDDWMTAAQSPGAKNNSLWDDLWALLRQTNWWKRRENISNNNNHH